jgi:GT2 family glycosyltransferase
MIMPPFVCIVVLNHNGQPWLPDCLQTLLATVYENFKVILVDNASTDASLSYVRAAFPDVEIIENRANLGFSAGNNVGIKRALDAGASYIVLLNPDTKVKPDWLAKIIEVGEREPQLGVLGAVQLAYENDTFNSWTEKVAAARLAKLSELERAQGWMALEWVEGSCFAVKRAVWQRIGLLDPLYSSFYEEIDFCRRAACVGYQTALVTASFIHHHRGGIWADTTRRKSERDYLCDRGQFIYALTDPRRSLLGNLKSWLVTLAVKVKESVPALELQRLAALVRIQAFLAASWHAVYRKWKRDQLLLR